MKHNVLLQRSYDYHSANMLKIVGTCLYHLRVTDPLLLVTLSSIASEQSEVDELTTKEANRCLACVTTFQNDTIMCTKSGVALEVHSNGAFFAEKNATSAAGRH